jgi:hypothetical protein
MKEREKIRIRNLKKNSTGFDFNKYKEKFFLFPPRLGVSVVIQHFSFFFEGNFISRRY